MKPIDQDISQRISILRTLLIMGIVVLHVPPAMLPADIGGDPFNFFKYGISRGLFRATVPVLTCISGYLLFYNASRFSYRKTLVGKAQRILFPFLLWNVPLAVALFVMQSQGIGGHEFSLQLVPFDPRTFADAALAYTGTPANYPLNFLRDLFIIFALSPLFLWLIRRAPWTGLIGVGVFFVGNWDGYLILRSTMPVCFYFGGMCAVYGWNLKALDRFWPVALLALIGASALIAAQGILNVTWFRLISPPLVWVAAAPLVGTVLGERLKGWAADSFFLFLSHGPLLLLTYVFYGLLEGSVPYPIYWLCAPVVVCAASLSFVRLLKRRFPSLAAFLVGEFKAMGAGKVSTRTGDLELFADPASGRKAGERAEGTL